MESNFSLTYIGVIVFVVGKILELAGLNVGSEQITQTIITIIQFGGALVALYGRYRAGNLKWFGGRIK